MPHNSRTGFTEAGYIQTDVHFEVSDPQEMKAGTVYAPVFAPGNVERSLVVLHCMSPAMNAR
jgi:hypothetical protein